MSGASSGGSLGLWFRPPDGEVGTTVHEYLGRWQVRSFYPGVGLSLVVAETLTETQARVLAAWIESGVSTNEVLE